MGKLTENAWINGVGYGPGFGDKQPPGAEEAPQEAPVAAAEPAPAPEPPATSPVAPEPLSPAAILASLPDEKAALLEFAGAYNLDVDGRLGARKLRTAIEEAMAAP